MCFWGIFAIRGYLLSRIDGDLINVCFWGMRFGALIPVLNIIGGLSNKNILFVI
jgi:hypothetical protein